MHQQLISYQDVISLFLRMLAQKAQADLGGMPGRGMGPGAFCG